MAKRRSKASKAGIIGCILALIAIAAIVVGVLSDWYKHFWIWNKDKPASDVEITAPGANMAIHQVEANGISLLSAPMPIAAFAAYDVSPQSDNVQMLTATIEPENASLKAVDFTCKWKKPYTDWYTGTQDVDDYITLSQPSDGALTCAVSVIQPFGQQIEITCRTRPLQEGDATLSARCSVDYYARITGSTLRFRGESYWNNDEGDTETDVIFDYDFNSGTQTIGFYNQDSVDYVGILGNALFSTGTIKNPRTQKITLKLADSLTSQIQSIIKQQPGTATLTAPEWQDAITEILGNGVNDTATQKQLYEVFLPLYNAGQCAFVVVDSYTDNVTGVTYSFDYPVVFNPIAFGVRATELNLDKEHLYFSLPTEDRNEK